MKMEASIYHLTQNRSKMKFVGFLKEEDKNIRDGKFLNEMFTTNTISDYLRQEIIEYLSNGIFLTGVMSFIHDNENKPIGNLDYFTDGEFIWPIYYLYYLKKYRYFDISTTLISHAQSNDFKIRPIDPIKLSAINREFDEEWGGAWKRKR